MKAAHEWRTRLVGCAGGWVGGVEIPGADQRGWRAELVTVKYRNLASRVYIVHSLALKSTAERIMAAARRLLDPEGSHAVTMRRMAKAVGITPMAIYRHVANRDDLLNALADGGIEDLTVCVANASLPAPERQLMQIVDIFLDFAFEKARMFELMFLERRKGARRFPGDFRAGKSPTAKFSAAALEEGMKQGIFRRDDVWEIVFEAGAMLQVAGEVGVRTPVVWLMANIETVAPSLSEADT